MTAQKYHIKLSEEERKELKKCLYASIQRPCTEVQGLSSRLEVAVTIKIV